MIASRMTVLCCAVAASARIVAMDMDISVPLSMLASLTVVSSNANRLKRTITSSMPARSLLLLVATGME